MIPSFNDFVARKQRRHMAPDDIYRRADESYEEWLKRTYEFWHKSDLKIFTAVDVIRAHAMGVEL